MNGRELLEEAIIEYVPRKVYALLSGGHDSLCATHLAFSTGLCDAAVHINTGIGIEQTREFVRDTCREQGWPLIEKHAKDCGQDYRALVLEYGFPGPPQHTPMYIQLKERALRVVVREAKKKRMDRVMLVSGCRSQESVRRMGTVDPIQKEKGSARVWVAIIHDWSKLECNEYIQEQGLERNPVVDLIHKSGECLCGAFAKTGELKELELWFPETAAQIRELEAEVKAAGFDWGWEQGKTYKREKIEEAPPLCHSCVNTP